MPLYLVVRATMNVQYGYGAYAATVFASWQRPTIDFVRRVRFEAGASHLSHVSSEENDMIESRRPLILGVGGTPRAGSVTERALAVSLRAAEAVGADTMMISGPDLLLPIYTPGATSRTPEANNLINAFRSCDAIILASPAYHGSLSGLMKNVLDYAEDLRPDARMYFDGVAVGLIACAGGWQAAVQTMGALRSIVHSLRGWPTPLGATINTSAPLFDNSGECIDHSSKFQLETVGRQVVEFAQMQIDRAALHHAPIAPTLLAVGA